MSESSTSKSVSVLMVCLGNICRSPMAEAVLIHESKKRKLDFTVEVDSAGTGAYHVGEEADDRTIEVCRRKGVPISCRARKVQIPDFDKFDYIFAMDSQNLLNLFSYLSDKKAISDPYYGGDAGFERAYQQCVKYSRDVLDMMEKGE